MTREKAGTVGHKIITIERGDAYTETGEYIGQGYAARCEDCDAITFGGFPSRSSARAALSGHAEA